MVEFLDKQAKNKIVEAIRQAERATTGEIRVHVKPRCSEDVLKEAHKTFRRLGMHRAKEHNAVLIFVAPKSRRFAIVGDEGIHQKVGHDYWNAARDAMHHYFSKGDLAGGILAGVRSVGVQLKKHFPDGSGNANGLPDTVSEG